MNFVTGSKASIFVRKTLQIRLRDRACGKPPAQARREGPAFFDEDDVCAGYGTRLQPHPSCSQEHSCFDQTQDLVEFSKKTTRLC